MAKELLSSDESDKEAGGVQLEGGMDFKVNEDFARKFTHNKKREELRRLEDKLAIKPLKRKRWDADADDDDREASAGSSPGSTSDSEDEDDAGELATEALDSEILATLHAIQSKDPRVYDKETTFYTQLDDGPSEQGDRATGKKEKPLFLRDYHRENLLNGVNDHPEDSQKPPMTYNQEQETLKRSIIGEINAATAHEPVDSSPSNDMEGSDDDGFLVAKPRTGPRTEQPPLDVENADKDPETFLSNFMAARAWVPSAHSEFQPFESDDEEEDRKAEEFEEAYNFRFEDPAKSNEKLVSHARDIAAKYSVRREEKNARKKQREAERERKEAAKRERAHEKARLRRLKIEQVQEKLRKIKKAAGLRGSGVLSQDDWARFLDDDWDDAKWEEEMQKRFGEAYYAQDDFSGDESGEESTKKGRKPRKPKWDDDIGIDDLIPDFKEEIPTFELSDEAQEEGAGSSAGMNGRQNSGKDHKKVHQNKLKDARKERRMVEQLVDDRLELDTALEGKQKTAGGFRYRDTSPLSFGLSARDILMADDSRLNEYVGLKKLASFRDPNKKKKDQKHLGKKARLRQWRKDTFGDEEGPVLSMKVAPKADKQDGGAEEVGEVNADANSGNNSAKKKRRRSKKRKVAHEVSV